MDFLRHSHASLLIEMGFNILMGSQRLGHEKVETTWQTYAHLYEEIIRWDPEKREKATVTAEEFEQKAQFDEGMDAS